MARDRRNDARLRLTPLVPMVPTTPRDASTDSKTSPHSALAAAAKLLASPRSAKAVTILGCDLSHCPQGLVFQICAALVITFHMIHGFFQELVVVRLFDRKLATFVTLLQYLGFFACANLLHFFSGRPGTFPKRHIPLVIHALTSLCSASNIAMTFLSMRWLDYPTKTLIKSSRVILTMALGIVLNKKRYSWSQWACAWMLVTGLVLFLLGDQKVSPTFHPFGIVCVLVALSAEVGKAMIQEHVLKRYTDGTPDEIIFYEALLASGGLLVLTAANGDLLGGIQHLSLTDHADPQQFYFVVGAISAMTLAGFAGTAATTTIVAHFGAVSAALTTTVRKAASITFSYLIFPKPFAIGHLLGGVIFGMGLVIKAFVGKKHAGVVAPSTAEKLARSPEAGTQELSSPPTRGWGKMRRPRRSLSRKSSHTATWPPASSPRAGFAQPASPEVRGALEADGLRLTPPGTSRERPFFGATQSPRRPGGIVAEKRRERAAAAAAALDDTSPLSMTASNASGFVPEELSPRSLDGFVPESPSHSDVSSEEWVHEGRQGDVETGRRQDHLSDDLIRSVSTLSFGEFFSPSPPPPGVRPRRYQQLSQTLSNETTGSERGTPPRGHRSPGQKSRATRRYSPSDVEAPADEASEQPRRRRNGRPLHMHTVFHAVEEGFRRLGVAEDTLMNYSDSDGSVDGERDHGFREVTITVRDGKDDRRSRLPWPGLVKQ